MANKAQSNIDLNNKQLLNAVFENLSIQPSNPKEGSFYYDTTEKALLFYNGSKWVNNSEISIEDLPDLSSLYIAVSRIGVASGVVPLDSNTKIDNSYINIDTELNDESSNTVSNSAITTRINTIENTYANNSLTNLDSTGDNYINTVLDVNSNNRLSFWAGLEQDYETATIDNNTLYFITDEGKIYLGSTLLTAGVPVATTSVAGKVKPDGTTIDVQNDGTISVIGSFANKDLNNLTSFGNARLQYQPFAINSGTVDANGENATLYAPGSGTAVQTFVQPTLSSDGTMGTSDFACTCNHGTAYYAFDNNGSTYAGVYSGNSYTCELTFYNKYPLKITQLTILESALGVTTLEYSDDNSTWTQVDTITYTPGAQRTTTWTLTNDTGFHNYYRFTGRNQNGTTNVLIYQVDITGTEQVSISTADTIFCDPCIITTADGRTKEFLTTASLSIAGEQGTMYVETPFVQPVLSANGTLGGDSFAVDAEYEYTDTQRYAYHGLDSHGWLGQQTPSLNYYIFYNPEGLKVSQLTFSQIANNYIITYTFWGSDDGSTWTQIGGTYNQGSGTVTNNINSTTFYKYHKIQATSAYTRTAFANLIITATYMQEISGGDYSIFKDFSTGELSIANLIISPTTPTNPSSGDYWLNNAQAPLVLKTYDTSVWVTDNDKVYLGDCTISSGVVSALSNNKFNNGWNTTTPHIVETYQNGTSYYRVYSDGWCEQGGVVTVNAYPLTVSYLKTFKNTDYLPLITYIENTQTQRYTAQIMSYTTTSMTISPNSASSISWKCVGYVA